LLPEELTASQTTSLICRIDGKQLTLKPQIARLDASKPQTSLICRIDGKQLTLKPQIARLDASSYFGV
jgi:tRNA(His) 5'-end guanylyltransferase